MAPVVDDEIVDHGAKSCVDFLKTDLGYFNRTTSAVGYLVGDNCGVYGRIAELLGVQLWAVPSIG